MIIPIRDDQVGDSDRFYDIRLLSPTGGTVMGNPWNSTVVIVDDEVQPTVTVGPAAAVREGDLGVKTISIPVHLSAPVSFDYTPTLYAVPYPDGSDLSLGPFPRMPAGTTDAELQVRITGDTVSEPDETYSIHAAGGRRRARSLGDRRHAGVHRDLSRRERRLTFNIQPPRATTVNVVIAVSDRSIIDLPTGAEVTANGAATIPFRALRVGATDITLTPIGSDFAGPTVHVQVYDRHRRRAAR